jgi:hypothetical protein
MNNPNMICIDTKTNSTLPALTPIMASKPDEHPRETRNTKERRERITTPSFESFTLYFYISIISRLHGSSTTKTKTTTTHHHHLHFHQLSPLPLAKHLAMSPLPLSSTYLNLLPRPHARARFRSLHLMLSHFNYSNQASLISTFK